MGLTQPPLSTVLLMLAVETPEQSPLVYNDIVQVSLAIVRVLRESTSSVVGNNMLTKC